MITSIDNTKKIIVVTFSQKNEMPKGREAFAFTGKVLSDNGLTRMSGYVVYLNYTKTEEQLATYASKFDAIVKSDIKCLEESKKPPTDEELAAWDEYNAKARYRQAGSSLRR